MEAIEKLAISVEPADAELTPDEWCTMHREVYTAIIMGAKILVVGSYLKSPKLED